MLFWIAAASLVVLQLARQSERLAEHGQRLIEFGPVRVALARGLEQQGDLVEHDRPVEAPLLGRAGIFEQPEDVHRPLVDLAIVAVAESPRPAHCLRRVV